MSAIMAAINWPCCSYGEAESAGRKEGDAGFRRHLRGLSLFFPVFLSNTAVAKSSAHYQPDN